MIQTTVKDESLFDHSTDCLIVFCREESAPSGILKKIDALLHGAIAGSFAGKRFEGKPNQTLVLNSRGLMPCDNLLLAGTGKARDLTLDRLRQASGTAAKLAEKSRWKRVSFHIPEVEFKKLRGAGKSGKYDPPACAVAEGACLALYHFDEYKSRENDEPPSRIAEIALLSPNKKLTGAMRRGVERATAIADAVWTARDLISHPSNKLTPSFFAQTARKMARKHGITCKVLGRKEMEKEGMGALLGVARGSHQPPAFIILEYFNGKKSQAPAVIVGKGITFDTGGISLKPSAGMDEMKMDMSGGAVTLGLMQAVAELKLKTNVVGLIPASENMPGGSAIKPGDILKSMSGKTIEVLNTDAEGRLILADALTYAERYKPRSVVDLATLTGAVIIALGHHAGAVLGNDSGLIGKLKKSGTETGERVWELPLWEEYDKAMKSDIADLKNIAGPKVGAGTITGAAFLKAFAGDMPWCHIDIAGTSWGSEDKPYIPRGPSGFGLRLLLHYLEQDSTPARR